MNDLIKYTNTNDIMDDACNIIESAQRVAIQSANISLVLRNWLLGKRISEEELKGEDRAEYGLEVVKRLSDSLTEKYGKGFSKRMIYKFLKFYKTFPEIVPTVSAQSLERMELCLHCRHNCCRGLIMSVYYRLRTRMLANGMQRKRMSRLGVSEL